MPHEEERDRGEGREHSTMAAVRAMQNAACERSKIV